MKYGYVYMLSNHKRSALYIGVTNDIERRILEHKAGIGSIHTRKYHLKFLMHFEKCPSMRAAIEREKQLKNWHRDWKWNLIRGHNPELCDLAKSWFSPQDIKEAKEE